MAQQKTQTGDDKQMSLNENEQLALQSHLEQWNSCKGGERHAVLNTAVKEARLLAPKMDKDALKHRKYIYKQWFYNHGQRKQRIKRHLIKYGQKWTVQEIIKQERKAEVKSIIEEQTGVKPGEKGMMKHYQRIVTEIMQGLTSDELQEAEATALAWSQEGPPADIQANITKTKGESLIKHFAKEMYRQAGMRLFVISAWKAPDGMISMMSLVAVNNSWIPKIGRSSWRNEIHMWRNSLVGNQIFVEGNGNQVIGKKKWQARQLFDFELNDAGMPTIPAYEDLDLQSTKDLIHDFITVHYRLTVSTGDCCQKLTVAVPWATILSRQEDFIETTYLPEGTRIKDPSKLKKADAQILLQFWLKRQAQSAETTFAFKAWVDSDGNTLPPVKKKIQPSNCGAGDRRPSRKSRKPPVGARTTGSKNSDNDSSEDDGCEPGAAPRQKSKRLANLRAKNRIPIAFSPSTTEDQMMMMEWRIMVWQRLPQIWMERRQSLII
ncbi:uncharacterized protein F5891DRAFT_984571 [Suillus fuscotomentosus]|uniref:Uncharacterized protein n=1 Tax=Suillus fuscotomentosus TaxID=1912939 RepID=A0AAD4HG58_9AGAM|nr:uncharacterized protein F5891DRAFT_984571 [Suillus fuscotomentosus]KAG1894986.1 hypothetical protein F5891DRAFT_984571 [Suillus fuscotomentosus]